MEELLLPASLNGLIQAGDLDHLYLGMVEATAQALGEAYSFQASLLWMDSASPGRALVIEEPLLAGHRYFRWHALRPEALDQLGSASRPAIHGCLGDLLAAPSVSCAEGRLSHDPKSWILPLRAGGRVAGAWMLTFAGALPRVDAFEHPAMAQMCAVAAMVAPKVFDAEVARREVFLTRKIHDAMHRAAILSDRGALYTTFLAILTRQFGMTRVFIGRFVRENFCLRCDLHTGFPNSFIPPIISMNDDQDAFVQCLHGGDVRVFDPGSVSPGSVGLWSAIAPPERAILIPLRIGTSPLGVIYADQVEHDGTLLPVSAVEMFGSLASTALENLTQRLSAEQRAETDPLTGLRNRAFLDKILEIELPRVQRYNTPLSLIMIDLDGFKRINDTWGHQFGDYILRETANLIQGNVRRPDVVVRYGGDEFVVLMVNTNLDQARLVCDRIEGAFVERNRLQTDERMMISISVGLRSADANSLDGILFDADMAMYAQKSRQRRQQLVEALVAGSVERIEAVDRVVGSLCNMLYKKAPYYADHARRVAHLALKLARRMGLSAYEVEILALAALLHDVGKVSLPTEILQKCAPLAPAEKEAMRHHPALGEEFFMGLDHMEPVRPLIRHHHERYDGVITGEFAAYPDGLVGEGIPLGARILKLAESVDSMLHDRPYRKARGLAEAKRILHDESGQSFDPRLVHIQLADSQWQEDLGAPAAILDLLRFEQP